MPDAAPLPRWLDAETVAKHVGIRPDYVARYVKAGKLPKPKLPWGPRQPRWDREELDAFMAGGRASDRSHTAAIQALADEIIRTGRRSARRAQAPR